MKTLFAGIFLLFSCLISIVQAQNGMHFEYKTTLSKAQSGSAMHMYVLPTTGFRSEAEIAMPGLPKPLKMVIVFQNQKPKTSIQINDEQKIYTEYSYDQPATQSTEKTIVQVIGKEKVNGFNCVHAKVTKGKLSYDMWTSKDITGYDEFIKQLYSQQHADFQDIWTQLKAKNADGFMVKMVSDTKSGMVMELVKAEKKTLSANLFVPPADYKKVDRTTFIQQQMPAMMKK